MLHRVGTYHVLQSLTRIISSEPQNNVTVVGHGNGILGRRQIVLTVQQTTTIEVQGVLQVDLLHVGVGRPANTDHFEVVAVQVERMAQVGLLNCAIRRNREEL